MAVHTQASIAVISALAIALARPPTLRAASTSNPNADVAFANLWGYGPAPVRERAIDLWFDDDGRPFTVDSRHVTVKITCTHFCVPGTSRMLAAADRGIVASVASDKRAYAYVDVPVPSDIPWGIYRAVASDDGSVFRSAAGAPARVSQEETTVSIPPAGWKFGEDAHLRAIRNEYVGKTVQGFGPLLIDCDDPNAAAAQRDQDVAFRRLAQTKRFMDMLLHVPPGPHLSQVVGNEPSLHVVAVDRPPGPTRWWKIGGPVENRTGGELHFISIAPLRVTFATFRFGKRTCPNARLWLADAWEVHRVLWIHAPVRVPETTPIVRGMSKLTVAHIAGYPDTFGSVDELRKLDFWHFPWVLPPFDSSVRFKNGRVVEYKPAGQPP